MFPPVVPAPPSPRRWRLPGGELDFARGPALVGILNLTPDSFSDGGRLSESTFLLRRARALLDAGATLLDLGGESTRPGAKPVAVEEELARVLPALRLLRAELPQARLSLDTRRAAVARAGVEAGAEAINDISMLADPAMAAVAASTGAGLIISHLRGEPATMQQAPHFDDPVAEVAAELAAAAEQALDAGVDPAAIVLDPGIGFGKTLDHNLALLRNPDALRWRDRPLFVGVSRKRMLGALLPEDHPGREDPGARDGATALCSALLAWRGVELLRVHEVAASAAAVRLAHALV